MKEFNKPVKRGNGKAERKHRQQIFSARFAISLPVLGLIYHIGIEAILHNIVWSINGIIFASWYLNMFNHIMRKKHNIYVDLFVIYLSR